MTAYSRTLLLVCAALTVPVLALASDPVVSYYDISGSNIEELRAQLNSKGPTDSSGHRFHALTTWTVNWSASTIAENRGRCRLTALNATPSISIKMPRWQPSHVVDAEVMRKWNSFLPALRTHEDGHAAMALGAAHEINALATATPSARSCAELAKLIDARATAILENYAARSIEYDAETRHGETQGSVL